MPNLIHSLDAASLGLLVNFFFQEPAIRVKNFYSIHDCFGTSASNVSKLINLLSSVYILIYSDSAYLIKLDRDIKNHIKNIYGVQFIDEHNKIQLEDDTYLIFPNLDFIDDGLRPDEIELSQYLLN